MPSKQDDIVLSGLIDMDEYISEPDAARLIASNNGRASVPVGYVNNLGRDGKLQRFRLASTGALLYKRAAVHAHKMRATAGHDAKPDNEVKPVSLRQRKRRASLKARGYRGAAAH